MKKKNWNKLFHYNEVNGNEEERMPIWCGYREESVTIT